MLSDFKIVARVLRDALADINVEALCSALEAYFLSLRSRPLSPGPRKNGGKLPSDEPITSAFAWCPKVGSAPHFESCRPEAAARAKSLSKRGSL